MLHFLYLTGDDDIVHLADFDEYEFAEWAEPRAKVARTLCGKPAKQFVMGDETTSGHAVTCEGCKTAGARTVVTVYAKISVEVQARHVERVGEIVGANLEYGSFRDGLAEAFGAASVPMDIYRLRPLEAGELPADWTVIGE